jgi:hypothetical protein
MDTAKRNRIAVVAALAISAVVVISFVLLMLFQNSDRLPTVSRTMTVDEALTITRKSHPETSEIQSNVQIRDWMGWVTMIETGKADGGATVGVYLGDPYAVEPTPVITSPFTTIYPTEPDAYLAIPEEQVQELTIGDQIRFSGKIPSLRPAFDLTIRVEGVTRLGPNRTTYMLPSQDLEIMLERLPGVLDSNFYNDFRVKIDGEGQVTISRQDPRGNVTQEAQAQISDEQIRLIAYEAERTEFFRLHSMYPTSPMSPYLHSPTVTVSVRLGDAWNSIAFDYGSEHPHARRLYILAAKIDEVVNIKQWLKQE